jgi:succinate dehydrogenase / fumarate reductase iron-sulfur subunit
MSTAVLETPPAPEAPIESFTVTLIIRRFDPDVDTEPRWQDFDVELFATDRILDALHKIKWEQDGSLTFRRSCAHGICGSDATDHIKLGWKPVVFTKNEKGELNYPPLERKY